MNIIWGYLPVLFLSEMSICYLIGVVYTAIQGENFKKVAKFFKNRALSVVLVPSVLISVHLLFMNRRARNV